MDDYLKNPQAHHYEFFWGSDFVQTTGLPSTSNMAQAASAGDPVQYRGIIQRADWKPTATGGIHIGFAVKMTFAKITDGASKTLMVSEKRVPPSQYGGGLVSDNRGWADGWDYDDLRSTMFPVAADGDVIDISVYAPIHYQFGSAHPGGLNAMFADGSVRGISYDVDQETFNRLGNRSDGETINQDF